MRCFISIDIEDDSIRAKIKEVQDKLALDGLVMVAPENLHFTLKFLGELNEDQIQKIDNILQRIDIPSFKMIIGGIGVFPGIDNPRTVWLGMKKPEKLVMLANIIERDLVAAGFVKNDKEIVPHLTIARLKGPVLGLNEKLEELKNAAIGKQEPKYFRLKKSQLTSEGSVYTDIKKYLMV